MKRYVAGIFGLGCLVWGSAIVMGVTFWTFVIYMVIHFLQGVL